MFRAILRRFWLTVQSMPPRDSMETGTPDFPKIRVGTVAFALFVGLSAARRLPAIPVESAMAAPPTPVFLRKVLRFMPLVVSFMDVPLSFRETIYIYTTEKWPTRFSFEVGLSGKRIPSHSCEIKSMFIIRG
jgi:hypothetical protein